MTGRISFSKRFVKQYHKAPTPVQARFKGRLVLFEQNQFNPVLRNHPLSGEWHGGRSIDVTGDWRAVYEILSNDAVEFVAIGTHSQLYR